jgi:hypothetical protein
LEILGPIQQVLVPGNQQEEQSPLHMPCVIINGPRVISLVRGVKQILFRTGNPQPHLETETAVTNIVHHIEITLNLARTKGMQKQCTAKSEGSLTIWQFMVDMTHRILVVDES